jgi:hypothetical protein
VPSDVVLIRFPTGGAEYRVGEKVPKIGDVLKRDGNNWVVAGVHSQGDGTTVVMLEPERKPA